MNVGEAFMVLSDKGCQQLSKIFFKFLTKRRHSKVAFNIFKTKYQTSCLEINQISVIVRLSSEFFL